MATFGKSGSDTLQVRSEIVGTAVVVTPVGDIDLTGSPTLRQELRKAQAAKPPRLVVNLAQVPYMDSSGVATLVEAMQVARRSGSALVICALQDRVKSIFEIARLDTVFTIAESLDAAMK
jgi:anti-sigma B factor antagonist